MNRKGVSKIGLIGFLIYLVMGAYLINMTFGWLVMPAFVLSIQKWIMLAAGILVVIGGINYLRAGKSEPAVA